MERLKLLKRIEYEYPQDKVLELMKPYISKRSMGLTELNAGLKSYLDKRICGWCGIGNLGKDHRRKYCCEACKESAWMTLNPQCRQTKGFILVEDQYGIGDKVKIGNFEGRVIRITMRSTVLKDNEGKLYYMSNGSINNVINLSQENRSS